MSHKSMGVGVIVVASLISMPPVTMAGGQQPGWSEDVSLEYSPNFDTGQPNVTVSQQPSGGSFSVLDSVDDRYGIGLFNETLVDFQSNPGVAVLTVTYAAWNFDLSQVGAVPLYVSLYAASAQPPELDSPPEPGGYVGGFSIPTGDSPYDIKLNLTNLGPSVCLLIQTENILGPGNAPIVSGFVSGGTVTEPTSFVTMAMCAAGGGMACAARRYRARSKVRRVGRIEAADEPAGAISPRSRSDLRARLHRSPRRGSWLAG